MLGQYLVDKERETWAAVPILALALAERCKTAAEDVRVMSQWRPRELIDAFYWPDEMLTINLAKAANVDAWHEMLDDLPYDYLTFPCGVDRYQPAIGYGDPKCDPPVVKIAMRPYEAVYYQEKRAFSPTLRGLEAVGGWNADLFQGEHWPSPVAAMLATGLLGAGAGYGLGSLAESAMPESWQREGTGRRTGAMLGGLAGVAPGALWAYANLKNGKSITEHWPFGGQPDAGIASEPDIKTAESGYPWWQTPVQNIGFGGDENNDRPFPGMDAPPINVEQFNQTVWHDPVVSQQLPPQTQALATGLITGAAHLAGEGRPATLISAMDVARMTAGMGTGYMSGALVGRALGALMGMPEETQEHLKQTGMWAGAIANIVPIAFGGHGAA
jgi:hypothetical protein